MIHQLLEPAKDIITQIPWVDRYGHVVQTAIKVNEIPHPETGEPVYIEQKYPVSCDVDGTDCWETGAYKKLIPDSSKKSIVYFEQTDALTVSQMSDRRDRRRDALRFVGKARLICWVNLKNLGVSECTKSGAIFLTFLNALDGYDEKNLSDPFDIRQLKYDILSQDPNDYNPFNKYSYSDKQALFLYPYDFMSFQMRIEAVIPKACIEDFSASDPIPCF